MSGKKHSGPVRACLIANARSGHDEATLGEVLPVLSAQGWDVTVREKHEKGEASELARKAADDGYDPIINCGGDGTLGEIVDALEGRDVAVGTIPGGTMNVWSREINVSQRARVAATQLIASERVRVDVGRVEIDGGHRRHFLMMAGLGADAAVMDRVSRGLKNRLGPLAIGVAAVEALPALKTAEVRIEMDGVHWQGAVTEVILGNTRRYGGFTRVTGEAYMDDGLLDVCVFTAEGVVATARQMTSLLLRQHPSESSAELYRAARTVIRAPHPLPLQLDGSALDVDLDLGEVEYDFSVRPHALTVLIPRTYDGELFAHGISPNGATPGNGKGKKKKRNKG